MKMITFFIFFLLCTFCQLLEKTQHMFVFIHKMWDTVNVQNNTKREHK